MYNSPAGELNKIRGFLYNSQNQKPTLLQECAVLMGPCRSASAVSVRAATMARPATPGGNLGENGNKKRTAAHAAVRGKSADNPRTISGRSADDQRTISGRSASDQSLISGRSADDQQPSGSTQAPESQGQSKRRGGLDSLEPESNDSIKEGGALPEQKIE